MGVETNIQTYRAKSVRADFLVEGRQMTHFLSRKWVGPVGAGPPVRTYGDREGRGTGRGTRRGGLICQDPLWVPLDTGKPLFASMR
jgi:hypothetical protein